MVSSLALLSFREKRREHLRAVSVNRLAVEENTNTHLVDDSIHNVLVQPSVLQNSEDPARAPPCI